MKTKRPSRRILLILIVAACAVGGYIWWHSQQAASPPNAEHARQAGAGGKGEGGHRGGSGAPTPVQAAEAVRQSVPQYLAGLGTVTATNTVTLRSRVDGTLMALHFTEGQQVEAGQLLAEIDPRPYQIALMQAQGQLAKDQATLANARRDLARYESLVKTNLVSRQEMDAQRALVSETQGTLKVDEASVASAQLNLTYSRVVAPISGRVGLKQVDVGNMIASSDTTGIVVITQTHPIDVVFSLPENDIATLLTAQKSGLPVPVEAWDRTNSRLLTQGSLLSMDNQIDATTGTVKLKARFSNSDDRLFPNQFVNARLKVNTLEDAIVIPTAALQLGNEGNFVWVVNAESKVSKKQVSVGMQDSHSVVVKAGLDAGERVVTDGIDRLKEGAQVEVIAPQATSGTPTNSVLPAAGAGV
ncbi:MdtA/MuxA family multidrug efflux RND transporter periplasmic adaptor subunit [Erwinia sp. ErVv1]|uniref:MdtA/MuxA family multidrug efflux RND transporter periplasmic adaptor subunit n=1 Tax=Erwinia sp. ErVv1 TaxID=1603299 RepID=UPI00082ADD89|nr:MdtA/MuxA family multidrug efflux RND transporter periplasmic adaptor subunit [Erwinia sp. ErVv1]